MTALIAKQAYIQRNVTRFCGRDHAMTVRMSGGDWENNKLLALAILNDRSSRRKWLGAFAAFMMGWMALGLWGINDWLKESPIRFLIYWMICAGLTLFVVVFALFDALIAIREERDRMD